LAAKVAAMMAGQADRRTQNIVLESSDFLGATVSNGQ